MKLGNRYLEHEYGNNVNILNSHCYSSLLAKACQDKCSLLELNYIVKKLFSELVIAALDNEENFQLQKSQTRMFEQSSKAVLEHDSISPELKAVTVSLARAGIMPSQECFEILNMLYASSNVRQDHFYMQRESNENGEVIGVNVNGSKIGGDIDNNIVLIPDPMAATGSSIDYTVSHYKNNVSGEAKKYIALHLIITPEYIRAMKKLHPDLVIYAMRVDRSLSTDKALESIPGTYIDEEQGLNAQGYIIPGAGGVGEVLNNAFV